MRAVYVSIWINNVVDWNENLVYINSTPLNFISVLCWFYIYNLMLYSKIKGRNEAVGGNNHGGGTGGDNGDRIGYVRSAS